MAETYAELLEKDFVRQIKFNHVLDYHNMDYKGKGITILNAEDYVDHGIMTTKAGLAYSPESTILNGHFVGRTSGDQLIDYGVIINDEKLTLEEAIKKYNIKIISRSYSGSTPKAVLNYYKQIQEKYGVIFFCSAGNEVDDNGIWAKDNTAIAVSASKIYDNGTIKLLYYGSQGEVDFTTFMAKGSGTSAGTMVLAAQVALLLQRYGDFTQSECVEILKSISIDIGNDGEDLKNGWGLPILPLTDKLEILEKIRGDKMTFLDVKDTDWFKFYVDICTDEGLIVGFEDGTFRPNNTITRAEMSAILVRLLEKLK